MSFHTVTYSALVVRLLGGETGWPGTRMQQLRLRDATSIGPSPPVVMANRTWAGPNIDFGPKWLVGDEKCRTARWVGMQSDKGATRTAGSMG
jgi:hypothetical protein